MPSRATFASYIAIGAVVTAGALPRFAAAADPGPIVVSELMWSGSDASSADEWVELYNRAAEPVDLAGWTLTRGDGDKEAVMVQIKAGTVPPGEVFLIANYDHDDARSRLAAAPHLVDAAVSLPNSKLRLRLYDGPPETARVIDVVDDGSGQPFGGTGGDSKASMERADLDAPGDTKQTWTTASEASGWDPGSAELGTPGSVPGRAPSVAPTQVSAAGWAGVKAGHQR